MNTSVTIALGALVLAGLALFAALSAEPTVETVASPVLTPVGGTPATELERRIQALSTRLDVLELASASNEPVPIDGFATHAELEALRAEVAALQDIRAQDVGAAPLAETPAFKEQVADTLSEIRKDEQLEKVKSWQEQRTEKLEASLPQYQEWLDLTAWQTNELRDALEARYEREEELVRLWEEGADDEVLGAAKTGSRTSFLSDLEVFLTPEQYETWSTSGK